MKTQLKTNTQATDGMILAALGVFVVSFDALLVRLADVDASTVSFYRGLFMGISMLFVWLKLSKRPLIRVEKLQRKIFGVIVFLSAMSTSLFVFSIKYTAAANTVVFLASAPFFAAIFTHFIIKESIDRSTLVAILISFVGVFIVFGSSFGMGSYWIGDLLGFVLAIVVGLELTLLRKYSHFPHMLIISLSGFLVAFVFYFVSENLLSISLETLGWLLLMGLVQMPLAMYLIFIATKYITSAQVSLFTTIETILAPVWLSIFLSEVPPKMTLVGGGFVILAILISTLPKIKKKTI